MASSQTYHARVLVLRKRKLGESDLILALLSGDGSLVEAVAKGARKPSSVFATKLELFCESEVLLARGRNLDIASEVRLLDGHDGLRMSAAKTYAASPILDCLASVALPNLPVEHLYDMATSALRHIDTQPEESALAFTAAFLVKLFAVLGVRPQCGSCIVCGKALGATTGQVSFSFADGGYICDSCAAGVNRVNMSASTLQWAHVFLGSTFDEIAALDVPIEASFDVLQFCHSWLKETQHINSKALNQLFTSGIF